MNGCDYLIIIDIIIIATGISLEKMLRVSRGMSNQVLKELGQVGGSGTCSPKKFLNFRCSQINSGGIWYQIRKKKKFIKN